MSQKEGYTAQFTMRVTPSIYEEIEKNAEIEGIDKVSRVRKAINEKLRRTQSGTEEYSKEQICKIVDEYL